MPTFNALILEPATIEDILALTEVWFAAFAHDPEIARLWPDTPRVHAWWNDANRGDMLAKPFQRFIKVIDPSAADARGRPRIAAWAKWDTSMPARRGRRYPPWCGDMPAEVCDAFFDREERERERVMGKEKHYCELLFIRRRRVHRFGSFANGTEGTDLDTLVTHPDYQRRGAGSMLLKWGCELADENGVGAYVDASKAGKGLYERFGFVDKSEADAGEVASMARRRRS
ncbi:putative acetyltransferase [Colletotrichum sublineola]|uniref:Putative acetyltransferase n=1 Tax=Colletotrichum sublineola TaxID=1173701 RepID=A0A066XFX3_COLSU|nr:putative acetyltransferase [Colletotrichum sublineola]